MCSLCDVERRRCPQPARSSAKRNSCPSPALKGLSSTTSRCSGAARNLEHRPPRQDPCQKNGSTHPSWRTGRAATPKQRISLDGCNDAPQFAACLNPTHPTCVITKQLDPNFSDQPRDPTDTRKVFGTGIRPNSAISGYTGRRWSCHESLHGRPQTTSTRWDQTRPNPHEGAVLEVAPCTPNALGKLVQDTSAASAQIGKVSNNYTCTTHTHKLATPANHQNPTTMWCQVS